LTGLPSPLDPPPHFIGVRHKEIVDPPQDQRQQTHPQAHQHDQHVPHPPVDPASTGPNCKVQFVEQIFRKPILPPPRSTWGFPRDSAGSENTRTAPSTPLGGSIPPVRWSRCWAVFGQNATIIILILKRFVISDDVFSRTWYLEVVHRLWLMETHKVTDPIRLECWLELRVKRKCQRKYLNRA